MTYEVVLTKSANLYARIEPDVKEKAESILTTLGIPASSAMTIETKKQTIVEMDIPAKPCTPVMEIWMWQSQGIVMVIMNHS